MTEAQKSYMREYQKERYHSDPEFRERSLDATIAWKYSNPDRVRLHAKRFYNKKQALIAAKANDVDSMVKYTKRYLECGAKLGIN